MEVRGSCSLADTSYMARNGTIAPELNGTGGARPMEALLADPNGASNPLSGEASYVCSRGPGTAGAADVAPLTAFYQPIVSATDTTFIACEVFARRPPTLTAGDGRPHGFIGSAKKPEVSAYLEEWILDEACRQLEVWTLAGGQMAGLGMWVGVSTRQLNDLAFPARVRSILARTKVEASRLALEVPESALSDLQTRSAESVMATLRAIGVRIVLVEFGSGDSSLRQILQMSIDGIKLDRSVFRRPSEDRFLPLTVDVAVAMAQSLGVPLVATGIESANQLEMLAAFGCGFQQGDAIARPMPAAEMCAWASRWNVDRAGSMRGSRSSAPPSMGIGEAARDLCVSASTIRRWTDCGRLTSIRTEGGHRRILTADVGREARRLRPPVKLSSTSAPSVPAPEAAAILDQQGGEVIDSASRDVYASRTSGWFSSTASYRDRSVWVAALAEACRTGGYPDVVRASVAFFRQAENGGATVLERHLLVGRVRIRLVHLLRAAHAEQSEVATVTRLMQAIDHATLEAAPALNPSAS
jgi:excisionase family DNA binding protein